MFKRRIGPDPHAGSTACPDIWELADGDFAVIGVDITATAKPQLPPTAGCGPDEGLFACRATSW